MPADLSQLGNILPMLGALAGGMHSPGVLAGLGDAIHEQNQRDAQQRSDARKAFADQLERIGMDSDNWTESARTAAMHARLQVLSNPKAGPKDFEKHWQSVLEASQRPDATQTMANAGHAAAADRFGAQAAAGTQSPGVAATGFGRLGVLGTQHAATQEQQAESAPVATVNGPFTPGEKAMRHYAAIQPMLQLWSGGGSGGNGVMPMWGMDGKGNPTMHMRVDTSRPVMLDVGEGGTVPGYWDAAAQSYVRSDSRTPVVPQNVYPLDRPMMMTEAGGPTGEVKRVISRNNSVGQSFDQPVNLGVAKITDNGVVKQFNRNPRTGMLSPQPFAVGTTSNRDIAERGLGLREQSNARQQGAYDYSYGGTATDVSGQITGQKGVQFVPRGAPIDEAGNPLGAKPYAQTRPPAAIVTRSHVAADASAQAQSILDHLEHAEMQGDFGALRGRALGWLVQKGVIADTDIKTLQLQLASMESMNPAVHQMRNFHVAQDIAARLGDLGQPYENFVAGVKTLKAFYDGVASSGTMPVVPTSKQRVLRPQSAGTQSPQQQQSQFAVGQRVRTRTGKTIIIKALSPDGSKVTDYEEVP